MTLADAECTGLLPVTDGDRRQIRKGRSRFIAMATAYSLGNFNDNFMKQAVSLLAVSHGLAHLQGWIATFFTIPFLLFSAPAGWMADRFSRKHVVIGSKMLELVLLTAAALGVLTLNWSVIMAVIFLMALQATIFGPALVGSIPDVYPDWYVIKANARLKSATTAAILLGVVLAGVALTQRGHLADFAFGRVLVAASLVGVSVLGLLISFAVPSRPAANPSARFPWGGPMNSIRDLWHLRQDGLFITAIGANTYFWFVAALQILVINKMGLVQFGLNDASTSYLALAELLGIVIGSLAAGKFISKDNGHRAVAPAMGALALFLCFIGGSPLLPHGVKLFYVLLMLGGSGIAGGFIMVPLESLFQVRPTAEVRGRVIAAAWFASFAGILMGSMLYIPLQKLLIPTQVFLACGVLTIVATAMTAIAFARTAGGNSGGSTKWVGRLLCRVARLVLRLRYRVTVNGAAEIKEKGRVGILFLPNHPALIDPVIMVAHLHESFAVRPLTAEDQIRHPLVRTLAGTVGVLPIPEMSGIEAGKTDRVQRAIDRCVEALRQGDNVLLYPAGRLMREQTTDLGSASAVERILARLPEVRVVLVRTTGLWGSSFGWGAGMAPRLGRAFKAHLPDLLASGIFFAPRRQVNITLTEPKDFPRSGDRAEMNRYMECFYNQEAPAARYVPYSVWDRSGERDIPASPKMVRSHSEAIAPATEQIVCRYLGALTGINPITADQQLARDLGLDSLAIMDLIAWLEREFGVTVGAVESLETVGDVMLAACGKLAAGTKDPRVPPPERRWLANTGSARVQLAEGNTIQEVFLKQARLHPDQVVVADTQRGSRSYRELITSIFALREEIKKIPDERVGIMLPASVAADTVFLAVLFSGKTPVMVNWTTGLRNIQHGLEMTAVSRVLTAQALLSRLEVQGIDLSALNDRMVPLEKLAGAIGKWTKVVAALKGRLYWRSLDQVVSGETAVILFTSGSESLPKAVPLSHENLLTNMRDALASFHIRQDDRFLGMLPPFHSFGLNAAMLLPILSGAKVVHYPNPNEVTALVRTIENYRASILLGTPTFLSNIVRASGKDSLASVRICVTGAEKCPQSVYDSLKKACPRASILEGYGITECSPFVSVAREDAIRPGSIGTPLPSIHWAIIDEESQQRCVPGQPGMLLVRGASIFKGYLGDQTTSPFVQWSGETWYRTGDLVKADADGVLTFVGRLKRFIKLGGEMISLPAIEEVLERQFPSSADTGPALAVIAAMETDTPELLLVTTHNLDRSEVNAAIRNAGLSGLHHIRSILRMEKLPVLGTGKIDYRELQTMIRGVHAPH